MFSFAFRRKYFQHDFHVDFEMKHQIISVRSVCSFDFIYTVKHTFFQQDFHANFEMKHQIIQFALSVHLILFVL